MVVSASGTICRNSGLRMARLAPSEPEAFLQSIGPETACNDSADLVWLMIADIRHIVSTQLHKLHMREIGADREGRFNGRRIIGGYSMQIGQLFIRLSWRIANLLCCVAVLVSGAVYSLIDWSE
jgi:hypothetical protein